MWRSVQRQRAAREHAEVPEWDPCSGFAMGSRGNPWCESCCETNLNSVLPLPDHEANDRIASVKKTLELLALASDCYTIARRLRPSYRRSSRDAPRISGRPGRLHEGQARGRKTHLGCLGRRSDSRAAPRN